jgi:hypothetical protein
VTRRSFVDLPDGWVREEARGFGPFVTAETLRRPDGLVVRWESRRYRKQQRGDAGSTWWAPGAVGWWIGLLFAVGSACFALGALPSYAHAVGARSDNLTFFVGSLFFTAAAFLLYLEVATTGLGPDAGAGRRWRALWRVSPARIDWWASLVQLVGTLFFNLSTGHALVGTFTDPTGANHAVWRPDAFGSVCFLVSSWLSWAEVSDGWWSWRPGRISWWIAGLNLAGSIAFGVSAVASKVQSDGSLRNLGLTNLGTFVGALCFLAGSVLLFPERTGGDGEPAPATAPAASA